MKENKVLELLKKKIAQSQLLVQQMIRPNTETSFIET